MVTNLDFLKVIIFFSGENCHLGEYERNSNKGVRNVGD